MEFGFYGTALPASTQVHALARQAGKIMMEPSTSSSLCSVLLDRWLYGRTSFDL
jgi:hypothetical protein